MALQIEPRYFMLSPFLSFYFGTGSHWVSLAWICNSASASKVLGLQASTTTSSAYPDLLFWTAYLIAADTLLLPVFSVTVLLRYSSENKKCTLLVYNLVAFNIFTVNGTITYLRTFSPQKETVVCTSHSPFLPSPQTTSTFYSYGFAFSTHIL